MIGYLTGKILEREPGRVLLDVGGVGYELAVPVSTFAALSGENEAPVSLHVHTRVREDAIDLYGFLTRPEKDLFEHLIAVNKVGPKVAIRILSGLSVEEIVAAIRGRNIVILSSIPGVGAKTAERIVLDLKGKVEGLAGEDESAVSSADGGMRQDLLSALVNLGYKAPAAARAIEEAIQDQPDAPFEILIRKSLHRLAR